MKRLTQLALSRLPLSRLALSPLLLLGTLVGSPSALAQEAGISTRLSPNFSEPASEPPIAEPSTGQSNTSENGWYYGPTSKKEEAKPLGRQRAELRARQRSARMANLRWFGISASRPISSGLPFTSAYNPSWTRPTGRRYVLQTSHRPAVIVSPYRHAYYR